MEPTTVIFLPEVNWNLMAQEAFTEKKFALSKSQKLYCFQSRLANVLLRDSGLQTGLR
jgi:hypothetical protein